MFWKRRSRQVQHKISVLVPFSSKDPWRIRDFRWVREYVRFHLPEAEIVIGRDRFRRREHRPFSKARAVNEAFKRSRGDVIVVLDSDALLDSIVIRHCAERIRFARKVGVRTWAIPYHHLYRLTRAATEVLLDISPRFFPPYSSPPPDEVVESTIGSGHGRRFGALCMIMPREAFVEVGGFDPRFVGWGSEDSSEVKILDTLWGQHFNTPNSVFHLWHPTLTAGVWTDLTKQNWEVRIWQGQTSARANDKLGQRYHNANGDVEKMQAIIEERGDL